MKNLLNQKIEAVKLVKPIVSLSNRSVKRPATKELKKIYDALWMVEVRFYEDLFDCESSFTYQDIYQFHLDAFKNNVAWVKAVVKPKYFLINESYFSKSFSPKV